jgi:hypothetical protein
MTYINQYKKLRCNPDIKKMIIPKYSNMKALFPSKLG